MGEKVGDNQFEQMKIFNTPLEISLRLLFIICKFYPIKLSMDKLIYFDYFIIHSSDIDKSQRSLHPKYPFRSTEVVVKRDVCRRAAQLLISKQLIDIGFDKSGIFYTSTETGNRLVSYFQSLYSADIQNKVDWLHEKFKNVTENELMELVQLNIEKWGGEFYNEAKFRGI
jgi:hypothetical protein